MSRGSSREEIGVFIKTSLGTRLALSVPPDTTTALLFREVERAHFNCLPSFGEIKVQSFMVKYKSCFYHLSHSMPLVFAFRDSKGPCFLHAMAVQANPCVIRPSAKLEDGAALQDGLHCDPDDVRDIEGGNMTGLVNDLETKCQLVKSDGFQSQSVVEACEVSSSHSRDFTMNLDKNASAVPKSAVLQPEENVALTMEDDCTSENSSATRSVADIIRRHYCGIDTFVESKCLPNKKNRESKSKFCAASPSSPYITPRLSSFFTLQDAGFGRMSAEGKRPDVGQRLLMASSKLGISPSTTSPVVSMYYSKGRKQFGANVQTRHPIFELSESSG